MKEYLVLSLCLVSTGAMAAEAMLSGQGKVLSEPDYVSLNIQVQSKCYNTPKEAREANDKAARTVVDFLNKHVKEGGYYNKVITDGGYTNPFQVYHRDKILCENTFQKQNTITLRTQKIKEFEALYDDIQKEVYAQFSTQPRGMIESSVTFVTMSSPVPGISKEKHDALERQAMTMALNDAKGKLQALFSQVPVQNIKVIEVSEMPIQPPPRPMQKSYGAEASMMMASDEAVRAPVQFDETWIHKQVYFRFTFDDVIIP